MQQSLVQYIVIVSAKDYNVFIAKKLMHASYYNIRTNGLKLFLHALSNKICFASTS